MVKFSLFPTAYWAENSAQEVAIIWKKGNTDYFPDLPESITWQAFHQLLLQTVTFLQSQFSKNATKADLVAYSGENRLIGLLCYCAIIASQRKMLMLNPSLPTIQQKAILDNNGVDFLITDQLFSSFATETKNLTACNLLPLDFSAPATLTLTSGSSGQPKAIVHSLRNHLANAEGVCELMAFSQPHAWLLSLPLFHVSGQGIVWRWLSQGATLVINEEKADFFQALNEVTHASLVPTQLQRYLARSDFNRPAQKFLLGGSRIPAELVSEAKTRNIVTFSGYGMTEMASTICAVKNEFGNVGKPLKGREVKIVDNEIWVKGESLGLGIWQKNGEIRPLVNAKGWLQTKDCGYWNAQNQLVVNGRLDNMFISGGENIQPESVETVLFQSGLAKQIFVLPVPDPEFGERPVAVVEFLESFNAQAVEKLQQFAKLRLEKFKQPMAYFPLESERYQQGGIKISRKQLQADFQAQFLRHQHI